MVSIFEICFSLIFNSWIIWCDILLQLTNQNQFSATMIFDRHEDAVFCARVSPNGKLIASGGQDDRGFVFTTQGDLVMALFGHKGMKNF